ncbi:adenosylcobinamide-phosphate synthase CbiB [Cohnella herbarum]|uniref:Cobalamin biosynthesis protein CobD n=1 Tax=Cohnella herbarum TaxID=2728023 RepID=A0A7Z2VFD0_9BACL|nr:adenosylcobinamide-phosphate synthase CbiB [Cohnella herbarum]QJD82143.1 cobalamin biosynthesis protein CobD [Cohnella herbarum]
MIEAGIIASAFIIDLAVGDPRALPHPVVGMGYIIRKLERPLRNLANQRWFRKLCGGSGSSRGRALKIAGVAYPIVLVGGSFALTWLLIGLLFRLHPWLAYGMEAWLISTTIATRGLGDAGMDIYRLLKQRDLPKSRHALSMIVGRDTDTLDESEITRGAVETVAENIVDAILSPLLFALIGGAPLAMAYRAANTLDSMVGYKNDKYLDLGWASARFDDVANFIPARLSALFIAIAASMLRLPFKRSLRTVNRDARLHPSPNSGFPESAVAGALGVQLGGLNYYKGVASDRARMGEPLQPLKADHIRLTVRLMYVSSTLFLVLIVVAAALLN